MPDRTRTSRVHGHGSCSRRGLMRRLSLAVLLVLTGCLADLTDTTQAMTPGSTVNGNINGAGKREMYTFNLATTTQFYFDALTLDNQLSWSLTGPAGTVFRLVDEGGRLLAIAEHQAASDALHPVVVLM